MSTHDAGSELDFTDTCRWSADGWCFTHSTEAGPVYCRRPTDAEILRYPEKYPQDEVDAAVYRATDPEHII